MKKYLTNKIQIYVYLCIHHIVHEKISVFLPFDSPLYYSFLTLQEWCNKKLCTKWEVNLCTVFTEREACVHLCVCVKHIQHSVFTVLIKRNYEMAPGKC